MKCDICGKGPLFGHNVSHSKRHTKRRFLPNIRPLRLEEGGRTRVVHICMRCLRTLNKPSIQA